MIRSPRPRQPTVVLVGRPNVGKSTLFNRVVGGRRAIVTPVAGTTRDVLREPVVWQTSAFDLVDTGGLFGASEDPLQAEVAAQGLRAIDDADLIVMLTDGRDGLVAADREVAERVRRCGVPVVLAVNKVDDRRAAERVEEFHALGFDPVVAIAAEPGMGVGDLLDDVAERLPGGGTPRLRPRAGIPDEIGDRGRRPPQCRQVLPRESVRPVRPDARERRGGDDARCRRHRDRMEGAATPSRGHGRYPASGSGGAGRAAVESISVTLARRAMKRADVAIVLLDASAGVGHRDAAIAGEAARAGCGVVLAANKWDLVKGKEEGFAKAIRRPGPGRAQVRRARPRSCICPR